MIKVARGDDSSNNPYYDNLEFLINKGKHDTTLRYILNVTSGFEPRRSVRRLAHIINNLMELSDWDCIYLDKEFCGLNDDVWDSFPSDKGDEVDIKLFLKFGKLNSKKDKRCYLFRCSGALHQPNDSYNKSGCLSVAVFAKAPHKKNVLRGTISFYYYILAVVVTIMICYVWHNSPRFKTLRRLK